MSTHTVVEGADLVPLGTHSFLIAERDIYVDPHAPLLGHGRFGEVRVDRVESTRGRTRLLLPTLPPSLPLRSALRYG